MAELVQRNSIDDATHRVRARVWIQDLLANLDLLAEHPSFLALAGKYRGVPAFIVGAGPSLGKNGKLLADAAQKGIVFAVNSSARALASYGVEPQVLACMESIDTWHLLEQVTRSSNGWPDVSAAPRPRWPMRSKVPECRCPGCGALPAPVLLVRLKFSLKLCAQTPFLIGNGQ